MYRLSPLEWVAAYRDCRVQAGAGQACVGRCPRRRAASLLALLVGLLSGSRTYYHPGLVHAWVGQILLNCNVFKRGNSSVPLRRELDTTMPPALGRPRPDLVSCLMTRRHPGAVS